MSLASLTIDLSLGLAKFEADSGKAAQIITRDTANMSRAGALFERQLLRNADAMGKSSIEGQKLKAVELGLGDATLKLIDQINGAGGAFASVATKGTSAFAGIAAAADAASGQATNRFDTLLAKIREVNAQASALKQSATVQNQGGSLTDDGLKAQLQSINATREGTINILKQVYAEEVALQRAEQAQAAAQAAAAAEELESSNERRLAAQKIIDVQNGLTSSYRTQLQALRELRDAGSLSPDQFKKAGADLVAKQPVTAARAADTDQENAAQQRAIALTNERAAATERLVASIQKINYDKDVADITRLRAAVEAENAAEQKAASEAASTSAERSAATQRLIADVQRINYNQQIQAAEKLQAAVEAESAAEQKANQLAIAAQQDRAAATERLVATVQKLNYDKDVADISAMRAAVEAENAAAIVGAQQVAAAQDERTQATAKLISTVQKLNYDKDVADIQKLRAAVAAEAAAESDAAVKRNAAAQSFVATLNQQAGAIGKSRTDLLALKAEELGVGDAAAAAISKLKAFDEATGQAGKSAFGTRNQLLTLHYTLSDIVASLASGISPFTILAQQGGQVYDAFGQNFTNIFKTILGLITPLRVAIGGVAGTVAVLGYAFVEGKKQSKEFADSLVLTGGYAGVTEGQFNAMAKGIAASGQIAISAAREFGQALVATGQVGPQALAAATEAATRYGAATGKNAKDVAQEFSSMTADVVGWATTHNKQLNFISAAQYELIKSMQESGNVVGAQGIVYDALNEHLKHLEPNLGTLDRAIRAVANTWHGFWDAAYDIGRTETIDDKISKLESRLAAVKTGAAGGFNLNPEALSPDVDNGANATQISTQLAGLRQQKATAEAATAAKAQKDAVTQRAITSQALIDQYAKEGKSVDLYKEKRKALLASFVDNAEAGTPVALSKQAAALKGLADSFKDNKGIGEADAQRKARLDQDLKTLKDNFDKEKEAYSFQQQVLTSLYSQSGISLKTYYDDKQQTIATGVAAELKELAAEQARIQQELNKGAFKDPHEKTQLQTQLNQSIAQSAKVQLEASRAAVLATLEQTAAQKALNDQVTEYRAALLQSEGDETGAAKLRAQTAINNAKLFQTHAGGTISDADVARQQKAIDQANVMADIQRRTGILNADAARLEESYGLLALQRGDSLLDQEKNVYTIRQAQLVQLQAIAAQTKAVADASTDPKYKAAAADAALAVQKAIENVDPALSRMRDAVKSTADSIADDIGGALNEFKGFPALFASIEKSLLAAGTKFFVTDPLKVGLEGIFRNATEGSSGFAGLLQGMAGVQGGAGGAAGLASQTAAISTSTATITTFTAALANATAALGGQAAGSGVTTGGSGGGLFGWLGGLFGTGGGAAGASAGGSAAGTAASDDALALFFHSGGVVGAGGRTGAVPASVFAGATRYHSGGVAGLASDEVPAILKKREEVLTTSDPRHRYNNTSSQPTPLRTRQDRPVSVQIQAAPNMSRDNVQQQGAQLGVAIQRAMRRRA